MKLWFAIAIITALFSLVHVVLLPAIERSWKNAGSARKFAKAGTVAALKTLDDFMKIALVVFIGSFLALGAVSIISPTFGPALLERTYNTIAAVNSLVTPLREWLSRVILWIALLGIFWVAWRMRRGVITEALEAERRLQVDALFADDAEIEDLPPSPEMEVVALNIDKVDALTRELAQSGGADAEARSKRLDALRDRLVSQYTYLDVDRRIDLSAVPIDDRQAAASGVFGWLRLGLFSKGMQATLSWASKMLKRVATAAACLLVIGIGAPVLAANGIVPTLSSINDLQVYENQKVAQESLRKIAQLAAEKPEKEPPEGPGEIDEGGGAVSVYRLAARQFAHALATSPDVRISVAHARPDPDAPAALLREADRVVEEVAIRDTLLREFAANSAERGVALRSVGFADADAMPPAVRDRYGAFREDVARPFVEPRHDGVVDRIEQWLRAKGNASPAFRDRLAIGVAAFQQPASLGDMFSTVFDEALSETIKVALPDPTDASLFTDKAFGATKGGIEKASSVMVQAKLADFLNDIEAGKDYAQAMNGVYETRRSPAYFLRTDVDIVSPTLVEADSRRVAATVDDLHPSLQTAERPRAASRVQRVVDQLSAGVEARQLRSRIEGSAGSYEDLFPGRSQSVNESPLGKALAKAYGFAVALPKSVTNAALDFPGWGGGSSGGGGASRSFARLSGSVRVGGVLIGSEPTGGGPLAVQDIVWETRESDVSIGILVNGRTVPIGVFEGEVVQQALAYAADERPVTVTMTSGPLMPVLRVHLHPALVDSRLGCEMMELDRFVDVATDNWLDRKEWSAIAHTQLAIYNQAAGDSGDFEEISRQTGWPFETVANVALPAFWSPTNPTVSLFAQSPGRFDMAVVERMKECAPSIAQGEGAYMACVGQPSDNDEYPAQPYAIWSGVRESAFPLGIQSLTPGDGDPALRFMLQVAFERASAEELEPETPWEFPFIADDLNAKTLQFAQENASAGQILDAAKKFTILQRLFRLALSGRLGPEFPRQKLIALMHDAARADPIDAVTTPDWNQSREVTIDRERKEAPSDDPSPAMAVVRQEYLNSVLDLQSGERFSGAETCNNGAYALQ